MRQDAVRDTTHAPLGSYTISSSNRLTTQSTTTETVKFYAPKLMASGKAKFTFNTQTGEFDCDDAEKAVSNCDLITWMLDQTGFIDIQTQDLGEHLTAIEARVLEVLGQLQEVQGTLHSQPGRSAGARTVCEAVSNATRAISEELDIVKNRQAVSAAISVFQLLLFLSYLGTQIVLYTVKKCRKHHAKLAEVEIELMESRLAKRKASRKSARKAAATGSL